MTVTLDVGTECGLPLLAVLFLSDGKSKPITSKTGVDLASTCFKACTLKGNIATTDLNRKIAEWSSTSLK